MMARRMVRSQYSSSLRLFWLYTGGEKSIENTTTAARELDGSGRCMIYRTDKEYIFVTIYYVNMSYPIKFLPVSCSNGEFENTLMEIFHASLHGKYVELKNAELIKAMKQRSWRQLPALHRRAAETRQSHFGDSADTESH